MLRDSINTISFCCNPVVLKKKNLIRPLKIAFLSPVCRLAWVMLKMKNNFFFWQKKKQTISFQKLFILSKYHLLWLSYEIFSILGCFLSKKGHSQLKQLCQSYIATTRRHSCSNKSLDSRGYPKFAGYCNCGIQNNETGTVFAG